MTVTIVLNLNDRPQYTIKFVSDIRYCGDGKYEIRCFGQDWVTHKNVHSIEMVN